MTYKLVKDIDGVARGAVMRIDDKGVVSIIPVASDNRDWIAYQNWLAQGNVPDPA